jgi:uncharacterized RDD family membrane protein YckC
LSKSASLSAPLFDPPSDSAATPAWKQEVNQRLAAHRTRRGDTQEAGENRKAEGPRTASRRAAEAAARVAARYAKAPSYSELLAGEARAVVRAAGAAAEAARNAQAAAQAVLEGLEFAPEADGLWQPSEENSAGQIEENGSDAQASPVRWQDDPQAATPAVRQGNPWAGAQPRWEEALPTGASASAKGRDPWSEMRLHTGTDTARDYRRGELQEYVSNYNSRPGLKYEQGVAEAELFHDDSSYDAIGSATVEPVQHLPANLIEFPRELVATRKARPRLAEGPFYDESHHNSQLSIFEVDPELLPSPVSMSDMASTMVAPPGWASIELEDQREPVYAHSQAHYGPEPAAHAYFEESPVAAMHASATATATPVEETHAPVEAEAVEVREYRAPQPAVETPRSADAVELLVAPRVDRLLASVIDAALVTLAFLAAAVVVIASTAHPPAGRIALIASGCGLVLFGLLYQFLFLSFAEEGTPGMRYARIALCTFDDDNPTRAQMRQRIPAMMLATLPAGLGLLWACFDKDHLGWHDRMTKTYQRKY